MSKKPRPSINDQLARMATQAQAPTVEAPRDSIVTGQRDDVTTLQRDSVTAFPRVSVTTYNVVSEPAGPEGYKRRVRYEKPHASIYAHPKVFKALREIAAATDCKPHDLYVEGLRMVLRQHGRDFDALNRGEK
ncbi:hypothetical protein FV228_02875 [Methylobacterium sp. WL18]|uniref:hypothetical protein n=1 Tax=Methylobacterium sp. WL18 TaxID=2603897 RepID=UPI0011C9D685|nr:hypothetical protein [Methylobacterium sp. WL18]TXN75747.1 hypothetical protein FV228_02875 [Methylobacterium sp. WL18]